ncbi:MAG: hypothetical protein ACR2HX_22820 [Pyrinomonadaceae bacterium]
MSSNTIDFSKLTIEDIFRAKMERRQRLASLPFDKKIEIVNKLRAAVAGMQREKFIFESFLKVCPEFAGEPIKEWDVVDEWYANRALALPPKPFDRRPDIIALTVSGKRIGIELKSWVSQEQIAEARERERIQDVILKAIGKQPPNETENIGNVWLSPKQVRFDARDAADFRDQLFRLIARVDNDWSLKPGFEQMCAGDFDRFEQFPLLGKYLHKVRFRPATRSRGTLRWIRFPDAGRHYSPAEMLETLESSLLSHRRDERYKDLRAQAGLDEVFLLIHYDFKVFAYNTPFDVPNFGFKEAAEFASNVLNGNGGYFDRVFLFHFLWGKEEAYRIF